MALCTTNTAVLKSGKKCKSRSLRVKDYGTYWYNSYFLDRHQVWRSYDPTSVHNFDFCGKKSDHPLLFHFVSLLY